jgi:hypothetical protein
MYSYKDGNEKKVIEEDIDEGKLTGIFRFFNLILHVKIKIDVN